MTKHIVGIILFTFIVGTSAVVAGLFDVVTSKAKSVVVKENYRVYKKKKRKKRCRRKRRKPHRVNVEANVAQAVYDKKLNQLTTSLVFSRNLKRSVEVDLHFFVKDEFGTQYLKKETLYASNSNNTYENSFTWFNRLESKENLYVMAKVRNSREKWDYQPGFIPSKATPVLLKSVQ